MEDMSKSNKRGTLSKLAFYAAATGVFGTVMASGVTLIGDPENNGKLACALIGASIAAGTSDLGEKDLSIAAKLSMYVAASVMVPFCLAPHLNWAADPEATKTAIMGLIGMTGATVGSDLSRNFEKPVAPKPTP